MTEKATILAFAGSTRRESWNKKLIRLAAGAAETAGAEVSLVDLADYRMPLYDGDLEKEAGIPEYGLKFKELMKEHDGFLISCPEYNSSISGVLKNTIDWASRQAEGEKPLECFKGKVVTLMSASPGRLGGLRGLVHVRAILGNIGCIVLPEQVAVPSAGDAFADDGQLKDESQNKRIIGLGVGLARMIPKIRG
ncbi:MAG TPA: NAD(P)H-dependent oxidoreductase [Gammaproteobacteria bacterium]|nr:NAD(P)H-dependent oxidoreductase [Gammaproteobacteria bacterium]